MPAAGNPVIPMTDFYSILANAIGTLGADSREARLSLYERAREALIAETRGPDPALNRSDFLAAWGSLEEAIGRLEAELEAEAQRERLIHRPTATTSTSLPRGGVAAETARPAIQNGKQRRRQLMQFLTRAFRRDPDGAPRPARGRPVGDFSDEMDSVQRRDNWLSDLLARASRDEQESGDDHSAPRRDRGRNG